jgi:endonuclease/exonuclease/phosphatase family metal-dependent hydrolase
MSFRVATYNLMRDDYHERNRGLQWRNREDRIIKLIKDIDADIIALQECRDIPNYPIKPFLDRLVNMGYSYSEHYNKFTTDKKAKLLRVVTLWKPSKFTLQQSTTFWLPEYACSVNKPYDNNSQPIARPLGLDILYYNVNSKPISIWNTHFPHSDDAKLCCVNVLPRMINKVVGNWTPVVLLGDFNMFGKHSEHHKSLLLNWKPSFSFFDAGKEAITVLETREENGTFVGTSCDPHKPALHEIGERLDFVLTRHVMKQGKAYIWNKTMLVPEPPYLQDRDMFPSDHLPVVVTLSHS